MARRTTRIAALLALEETSKAKAEVLRAIRSSHGDLKAASAALGIARNTLISYVEKLGLGKDVERFREAAAR